MKWITRERPKIDRIACPWLVARFIDKQPEFLFVPPRDVLRVAEETGAIPYDIPGVELTHEGERCSFDTFLRKYKLEDDGALMDLALIVRGADTERLDLTPQSAGLFAISLGLSLNFADDHEMLRHGLVMYDALYAWCQRGDFLQCRQVGDGARGERTALGGIQPLAHLVGGQVRQQHAAHRRAVGRQPAAEAQVDAHDLVRRHAQHVDDVAAFEHRGRARLLHIGDQRLHHR